MTLMEYCAKVLVVAATVLVVSTAVAVPALMWKDLTTDTAVYELETGEYLHCTPQGGDELRCEVTHR